MLPILQNQHMMLNKREQDINIFKAACSIVKEKKHTTKEGQETLLNLSSQLSSKMTLDEKAKLQETNTVLNSERVLGITDAEGHFSFTIVLSKSNPNNTSVNFNFLITQESSEIAFLNNLVDFFGCGNVFTNEKGGGTFAVHNKKDLLNKIVPFFEINKLQTIKKHSFNKFKEALDICINNKPFSPNNVEQLNIILSNTLGKRPKK